MTWSAKTHGMKYLTKDQNVRFAHADQARSDWVHSTPAVRRHEVAILDAMTGSQGPVLELGAGEGLLLSLRPDLASHGYIGCDLHLDRARSIRQHAASFGEPAKGLGAQAICCDAVRLPFAAKRFGTVLCRDLLHHLKPEQRHACIAEIARVLATNGTLIVVEPNARRSPLVRLFSAAIATERMALSFDARLLTTLLAPHFADINIDHIEASMLYRALLHYRFGIPALSRLQLVGTALVQWEKLCTRFAPVQHWTYIRARCSRPLPAPTPSTL